MIKFIVTGTGRSGTVYMARVLTDWGLPCGHESIFNNEKEQIVLKRFNDQMPFTFSKCSTNYGWMRATSLAADSSYMAVPYLNHQGVDKIPIIHVVRNPLAVVSSFVKDLKYFCDVSDNLYNEKKWEEWIYTHCPEIKQSCPFLKSEESSLERACCYWTVWNQRIEDAGKNRPYHFYRVEDKFDDAFFKFINIPKKPLEFLNKKINTMKKRKEDFTTMDIPEGQVKQDFINLMAKYGYI